MPRTSDKADRILDYVTQFVQEHGYAPSVREIGAAVGLRSTASVSYHIQALQAKGLLLSPRRKGPQAQHRHQCPAGPDPGDRCGHRRCTYSCL